MSEQVPNIQETEEGSVTVELPARQHRDSVTGQYDFDGDYDRLCKCGHSLGVHSAGGFYCDTDAIGNKEPAAKGCKCERFRPNGKRRMTP